MNVEQDEIQANINQLHLLSKGAGGSGVENRPTALVTQESGVVNTESETILSENIGLPSVSEFSKSKFDVQIRDRYGYFLSYKKAKDTIREYEEFTGEKFCMFRKTKYMPDVLDLHGRGI